jgi:hypothetical protein
VRKRVIVSALFALVIAASASDFQVLGPIEEPGEVVSSGLDDCTGTLRYSHDMTFEGALAWTYGGVTPPYYGAFGEGYLLDGDTVVECIALWLTDITFYAGQTCDCYIWEGGVSEEPGGVLTVMVGFDPGAPAYWPDVSQHNADIPDYTVTSDEITVGYWGNWPGAICGWFCAADYTGPGGHPWTMVHPSQGYGTGWIDPTYVWGPTMSMGIGFYYGDPVPAESPTWGSIKELFK